jgi:hypothetical protein
MATFHGSKTVVTFNGTDISAYTNSTDMEDTADTHDITCYGVVRKAYGAGLGDGKFTIKGVHNDGANNPREVIKTVKAQQQAGTTGAVTFIYRPEGTGSGKAQSSVAVLVSSYKESSPVGDYVRWEAELQMTGTLTETDQ